MEESRRTDKWLWEVRLFKTRSLAAVACRSGKVRIDGNAVKPSRILQTDDVLTIHQSFLVSTIRVIGFPKSRVSSSLVKEFMEDLTPEEEISRMKRIREVNFERRDHGAGRPTKRERRNIDLLKERWKD